MSSTQPLRILITGGARGIGRGLFRHFLGAGHSVYILDSNSAELEHVRKLADSWKSASSPATWKASLCDLRDRAAIKSTIDDVKSVFDGKLDVLINNAGHGLSMPALDTSIAEAKKLFNANFFGILETVQAFQHMLIRAKGVIVNNSSMGAYMTLPFIST